MLESIVIILLTSYFRLISSPLLLHRPYHHLSMDDSHKSAVAELDESLYHLEGPELDFYRRETGIEDKEQLKQHILAVQRKAYEVSWGHFAV